MALLDLQTCLGRERTKKNKKNNRKWVDLEEGCLAECTLHNDMTSALYPIKVECYLHIMRIPTWYTTFS